MKPIIEQQNFNPWLMQILQPWPDFGQKATLHKIWITWTNLVYTTNKYSPTYAYNLKAKTPKKLYSVLIIGNTVVACQSFKTSLGIIQGSSARLVIDFLISNVH